MNELKDEQMSNELSNELIKACIALPNNNWSDLAHTCFTIYYTSFFGFGCFYIIQVKLCFNSTSKTAKVFVEAKTNANP